MLKLLSVCDDSFSLSKFNNDKDEILNFMSRKNIDGLELVRWEKKDECPITNDMVKGIHLSFWPVWLDYIKGDEKSLLRQFHNKKAYEDYYMAKSKDEFIKNYRNELLYAKEIGAKYVVFHLNHMELAHGYNGLYSYSDEEVIDEFTKMLNEIIRPLNLDFDILFENLWYRGLTLLDKNKAKRLLDKINYKNKGFVLDIGHMMITNTKLKSEEEAVFYIKDTLNNLEELINYIKVIHINSSLSGEYIESLLGKPYKYSKLSFEEQYSEGIKHVSKMDTHIPFKDPLVKEIISLVNPSYIVYEFSCQSLEELEKALDIQNHAIES